MRNKKRLLIFLEITTAVLVVTAGLLIAWKAGVIFKEKETATNVWETLPEESDSGSSQSKVEFRTALGGECNTEGIQKFNERAENYNDLLASMVWSFPAYTVRTIQDRDSFLEFLNQNMSFVDNDTENKSIQDVLSGLDEAFFQKRDIVLVFISLGPGNANRLILGDIGVSGPWSDPKVWGVSYLQSREPDAYYSKQHNVFWVFSLEEGFLDNYENGVAAFVDGLIQD